MSYGSMAYELMGMVPKLPLPLAKKLINHAWRDVRRKNLWSFQLYEQPQWITPATISTGTATTTQGSASVVVDAAAAAAITAGVTSFSSIPQRQFRVRGQTIYNITAWDAGTLTLTLDRVYGEVSAANTAYQIIQCYYAAPYIDHLFFLSVRDIARFTSLMLDKTREYMDSIDPMRMQYGIPSDVLAYRTDTISTSTTYKYMLYELWRIPSYTAVYQLYGVRKLPDFTSASEEVPPQIGEDVILEKGKYFAYQWAEAHKDSMAKGGPDYRFLMGEANKEYDRLFREYRKQDRETVDVWLTEHRLSTFNTYFAYYNTLSGRAYPGM